MSEQLLTADDIFTYGYRKGYEDCEKEPSYDPHSHDIPPLVDGTRVTHWLPIPQSPKEKDEWVYGVNLRTKHLNIIES